MGLFDSKQETETTSRAYPWQFAAPGLRAATDLITQAGGMPLQFFPGQTYAPQTESERMAIEQLQAGAGAYPGLLESYMGPGAEAWQQALGAPGAALGMGLQDVANNPALSAAADAIQARVNRNLQENIMPGLTTQYMGTGGLGGTRQGVAEGLAAGRTSDVLSEQLANMYGNAWAQGLGAETSRYLGGLDAASTAMGRLPGMVGLGLTEYTQPAELLGQAGGLERAEEQRAIDEERARFEFGEYEPFKRAGLMLSGLMGPAQAFGASQTKSEVSGSPSMFSQLGSLVGAGGSLLGGLGGLGAFGGLGGAAGLGGGMGAAGGLGLGQLGYGLGYGINPFGQQANMLASQWA